MPFRHFLYLESGTTADPLGTVNHLSAPFSVAVTLMLPKPRRLFVTLATFPYRAEMVTVTEPEPSASASPAGSSMVASGVYE